MAGNRIYSSLALLLRKHLNISNAFFGIILIVLIYIKYPEFKKNSDAVGLKVSAQFTLSEFFSKKQIVLPDSKKIVLVFWASWCGPCKVELKRLNQLVISKQIDLDQIVAVSIDERKDSISEVQINSKYEFQIVHDSDGKLSEYYKISGTPTVLLIDETNKIRWRTTGISPSLELRVLNFL